MFFVRLFVRGVNAVRARRDFIQPSLGLLGSMTSLGSLASLASAGILAGCAADTVTTLAVEPLSSRSYRVITRRDHDRKRPAPVLFALHAYATLPDVLVDHFSLLRHAVAERGWILVVPEGTRDDAGQPFWNATAGCCGTAARRPDDLGYLHGIRGALERTHAIDGERAYALGVSNGGFMAHRWACSAGGDLRAIVSVSGVGPGPEDPPCTPTVPVSVLQIHGTRDEVIRYEGGEGNRGRYPSVRSTVDLWRTLAGAGETPHIEERRSLFWGTTKMQIFQGPRARVALWTVDGGGHHLRKLPGVVPEILDFLGGR